MSRAETIALLRRGKGRVKRGWCKFHYGLTAAGEDVGMFNPADKHCAIGAVVADKDRDNGGRAMDCLNRVARLLTSGLGASGFNDLPTTELRHVLGLYDWAIALAEADARKAVP